jgi:DNA-binding transcriptional LysR family regulator
MLDGLSLDQLRTFIAAADEGSFSAAGRRLKRAQSVVSQTLANLESQIGVKLFDRRARFPVLTAQGRALLPEARAVAGGIELFKARAKCLAGGLEPELSVAVDVLFPEATFTAAVGAFQTRFPATLLRFEVESSVVIQPVLEGACALGVVGSWTVEPPQLTFERLLKIRMPVLVAPHHRLAAYGGPIPAAVLAEHVQLIHINPIDLTRTRGLGLQSPRTWRLSHLGIKLAFLRAGFGFGSLPLPMVEADLANGTLIQIQPEDAPAEGYLIAMSAVYRKDTPPGPAGRWFIDQLRHEDAARLNDAPLQSTRQLATHFRQPASSTRPLSSKNRRRTR